MSNLIICPVGVEFHEDGQTDVTKLIAAFCNFADAHKNHKPLQRDICFSEMYNLIGDGGEFGGL
jgi:hypothetical protein